MGAVIVRHYPTKLFLKAADHTYVECGSGAKGWRCWGGKTGGTFLRTAAGSTLRADAIAEPDERAGITCYLINGVCHQAANRILDVAEITVDGVRGYSLSVSLFGLLGRPKGPLWTCKAPFDKHVGVAGDLPECLGTSGIAPNETDQGPSNGRDFDDLRYMADAKRMYSEISDESLASPKGVLEFQMGQFKLWVNHKFLQGDSRLSVGSYANLMTARERFETARMEAEETLSNSRDFRAFAETFDALTLRFQVDAAESLDEAHYVRLFDLSPDDRLVLTDPDIVEAIYGSRPDGGGAAA